MAANIISDSEGDVQRRQSFQCPDQTCVAVTVYSDRAEVKRRIRCALEAGSTEVLIKKLPSEIDKESIRVDGRGKGTICEVQYQEKHVKMEEDATEQQKAYKQQLEHLNEDRKKTEAEKNVLQRERHVIIALTANIAGEGRDEERKESAANFPLQAEINVEWLNKFLTFYRQRMGELNESIRNLKSKLTKIDTEIKLVKQNLQKVAGSSEKSLSREVSIILKAEEEGEVELVISYMVKNASWTPSYDFRVFGSGGDRFMKVYYYGLIEQNSGENWNDTNLSLSTATPSIGGQVPQLKTLRVLPHSNVETHGEKRHARRKSKKIKEEPLQTRVGIDFEVLEERCGGEAAQSPPLVPACTSVKESVISTKFEVARKGSVPSDGSSHKVNVAIIDLKPKFEYETVPAKDPYAYLKARVVNQSSYPFLAGPVSVFVDNNFVAKSHLNAVSPMEEFTCGLGIDPAIRIEYKSVKYREECTQWGVKITKRVHEQKIEIRNTRVEGEDAKVKLMEQIPLSEDDKVKVTLLEPEIAEKEGADLPYKINKDNNLEWVLSVDAGAKKEVLVKYIIEHPADENIKLSE